MTTDAIYTKEDVREASGRVDDFRQNVAKLAEEHDFSEGDVRIIAKNYLEALQTCTELQTCSENSYDFLLTIPIQRKMFWDLINKECIAIKLQKENKTLQVLATIDPLTKLRNRRGFEKGIIERMGYIQRETYQNESGVSGNRKQTYSLIMLDIDYFKKINDTHGHTAGDYVLVEISKLLLCHSRKDDLLARWGGEEFIIMVKDGLDKACAYAELIRSKVEENNFFFEDKKLEITISIGVTEYVYNDKDLEKPLNSSSIIRTDEALYQAKKEGRNNVICV